MSIELLAISSLLLGGATPVSSQSDVNVTMDHSGVYQLDTSFYVNVEGISVLDAEPAIRVAVNGVDLTSLAAISKVDEYISNPNLDGIHELADYRYRIDMPGAIWLPEDQVSVTATAFSPEGTVQDTGSLPVKSHLAIHYTDGIPSDSIELEVACVMSQVRFLSGVYTVYHNGADVTHRTPIRRNEVSYEKKG